jgi:hypothetical protein
VQRHSFELLIPASIVAAILAAAAGAIRVGRDDAASALGGDDPIDPRRRDRGLVSVARHHRFATADQYIESLSDTLLERHPALEAVAKEQFAARALDSLRGVVAEDRTTAARAAIDELALARAFDWSALCADWLGEEGGDDDPRIDARVDLLAGALIEAVGDPFTQRLRGDHFLNVSKILASQFPSEVGLFLDRDAGGVYVRAALRDTDVAAKGLRAGDRVVAIDGEPAIRCATSRRWSPTPAA